MSWWPPEPKLPIVHLEDHEKTGWENKDTLRVSCCGLFVRAKGDFRQAAEARMRLTNNHKEVTCKSCRKSIKRDMNVCDCGHPRSSHGFAYLGCQDPRCNCDRFTWSPKK